MPKTTVKRFYTTFCALVFRSLNFHAHMLYLPIKLVHNIPIFPNYLGGR